MYISNLDKYEILRVSGGQLLLGQWSCSCVTSDGYPVVIEKPLGSKRNCKSLPDGCNETSTPPYFAYTGFDSVDDCIAGCEYLGYKFCGAISVRGGMKYNIDPLCCNAGFYTCCG